MKILGIWKIDEGYKYPTYVVRVEEDRWASWTNGRGRSKSPFFLEFVVHETLNNTGRFIYCVVESMDWRSELIKNIKSGKYEHCRIV